MRSLTTPFSWKPLELYFQGEYLWWISAVIVFAIHINFTSLLNGVGGMDRVGRVGRQNVWCEPKKIAGFKILLWVEQMILWTFIMILWRFTSDSSLFSVFTHWIVMNILLNLMHFTFIHISLFPWEDIISKDQKIKSLRKILQYEKSS